MKEDLSGWCLFSLAYMVIVSFTAGLGGLLAPNVFRATKDAIANQTAPEIAAIFNFDNLQDDAVAMLIYGVAVGIGNFLLLIPGIIAMFLFNWSPQLAAEGHFEGAEVWKASMAHAKGNVVAIFLFGLVGFVLNSIAGVLCVLPLLVSIPVTITASWLFYDANRDDILQLAQQEGLVVRGG